MPFLPLHMYQSVEAPGNFIIGMSRIHMDYVLEHTSLKDVVIMLLDEQIIIEDSNSRPSPDLPDKERKWLVGELSKLEVSRMEHK